MSIYIDRSGVLRYNNGYLEYEILGVPLCGVKDEKEYLEREETKRGALVFTLNFTKPGFGNSGNER